MHHVLMILTLTFIQGHTDRNHEYNTCLIISETIQAMPSTFAVKIVRLKVYMNIASPMTLAFLQGHKWDSIWLLFNFQYVGEYLSYYIQTWHDGRAMHGIYAHARFDDLGLYARS